MFYCPISPFSELPTVNEDSEEQLSTEKEIKTTTGGGKIVYWPIYFFTNTLPTPISCMTKTVQIIPKEGYKIRIINDLVSELIINSSKLRFNREGFLKNSERKPFLFVGHRRSNLSDPASADSLII